SLIRAIHNYGASLLAVIIAAMQAPERWLAVVWIAMALGFALLGRNTRAREFSVHAVLVSIAAFVAGIFSDLSPQASSGGVSVRVVTLGLVVAGLYALCWCIRAKDRPFTQQISPLFSWLAGILVSLVLWYELQVTGRALGWALFGVLLFEFGMLR